MAVAAKATVVADHPLGSWDGAELISPSSDEDYIRQLAQLFPLVLDRCEQTLASLPYPLRCWLKSYNLEEFFPKPFAPLQKPATRQRYQRHWQRFLCFLFRAWRMDPATRAAVFGPTLDLLSYETQLGRIWDLLEQADQELSLPLPLPLAPPLRLEAEEEEEKEDPNPWYIARGPMRDELLEQVFKLNYTILTTLSPTGHSHRHCPLVYFIGVLGIHSYNLAYFTAYHFTPTLAGLLWVSRLLLLEYALPLAPYRSLDLPTQAEILDCPSRFQDIRRRFLCRGGSHTASYLIELLAVGRAIARKEGPRTNISWSADGQSLVLFQPEERQWQLGQGSITLLSFREMVKSAICHCHQLTEEMMFGWQPLVDLNRVVDNFANRETGYSFLREPTNNLHHSFKELLRRAWAGGLQAKNQWQWQRCRRYLRQFEQLQLQLLVCSHLASGMPSRGTEINIVKWQNTPRVVRNIYISQGRVMLVFEYSKTRARTNHSFYVVRILPLSVSRLWFLYLTYIRPFVDCLRHRHRQHQGHQIGITLRQSQQAYAFLTPCHQLYTTPQLSGEIRRLSLQYCGRPLTVASYRQVVAAIAKRYVRELVDSTTATTTATATPFRTLAYQFGHQPQMLAEGYGLDKSCPAKLQPELIDQYKHISACWHRWLRLADFEHELTRLARSGTPAVATAAVEALSYPDIDHLRKRKRDEEAPIQEALAQVKRGRKANIPDEVREALQVITNFLSS